MKGKVKFSIQNNHIAFKFDFERNVTVITGDSGTGKTKLINMVRNYSELGKASGVKLKCYSEVIREDGKKSKIERPFVVLSGNTWDTVLEKTKGSIVFVEESTSFLTSHELYFGGGNEGQAAIEISRPKGSVTKGIHSGSKYG